MQFSFGSGQIFGYRGDIASGTPVRMGVLQDVSVDISFTEKSLYGQNQFAVTIARAQGKLTGKAKFARLNGLVFNSLFFGLAQSVGKVTVADAETGAIPATPFAVTVTNSATFQDDLGVVDATTLAPYTKVASAPATGQYMVVAGIYTFAAADTGKSVLISYTYTAATGGNKITITNQVMGTTPWFTAVLYAPYQGAQLGIKIRKATSSKLTFATKLEDFLIPEMDFEAMDDGSGNILDLWLIE